MRLLQPRFRGLFCKLLVLSSAIPAVWAQAPLSFYPVTPCRVVDSRPQYGGIGPIAGGSWRSVSVTSSGCGIPASAAAFSLNVTAVPLGPLGFLSLSPTQLSGTPGFATLNALQGQVVGNAAIVPAGANGSIWVFVDKPSNIVIDIDGFFAYVSQSNAGQSTALGDGAGSGGSQNTAIGVNALSVNAGTGNVATGYSALANTSTGNNNVGIGSLALNLNSTGGANTGIGTQALYNNLIGSDNLGIGFQSLWANQTGNDNVAIGVNALYSITTGSSNIAIGYGAGSQVTGVNSNNIEIGNAGQAADTNLIRIGTSGVQTNTYLAGVYNAWVGSGATVVVNANGQLGTVQSSARFKEDIRDMETASDALLRLRPVTFHYKSSVESGPRPLQYGLIAEEVAKVYPELVVYGPGGRVDSVQYHQLPALLLNELQKEHRAVTEQQEQIRQLTERISSLEKQLSESSATSAR